MKGNKVVFQDVKIERKNGKLCVVSSKKVTMIAKKLKQ